jgi:3-polyprenyl-4-hydroxybenzoate decarboxylase
MMGSRRNKITIVVDDDIDIFDMEKVLWAIATRTQADQDVIVFPRVVATAMDPSVRKLRVGSALGIDGTKAFGQPFPEMVRVPGGESVSLDDLREGAEKS